MPIREDRRDSAFLFRQQPTVPRRNSIVQSTLPTFYENIADTEGEQSGDDHFRNL